MKHLALALILLVAGFAVGYAYSNHAAHTDYQHERELRIRTNAEASVRFSLMNIERAQVGEIRNVLSINCFVARTSLPLVKPDFFEDPEKQKEVADLVDRTRKVITALQASEMCPRPLRGP